MLFISKTQFQLHEDTPTLPKKFHNKQKKAIHHKISQILGLQLLRSSKDSSKTVQDTSPGKYQLLREKNDNGSSEDLRKTYLAINEDRSKLNQSIQPQRPKLCGSEPTPSTSSSVPRQRKLTPPPQPDQLISSDFPSTRSNRKGKNPPETARQRKKSICEPTPPQVDVDAPIKETCVNVRIGRMVYRKYIPRLQRIEEHGSS